LPYIRQNLSFERGLINGVIENDKLFAISTLKHEIGHLHYKDSKRLFLVYASITGIAYIINHLAKRSLLASLAASSILYSLGAFTVAVLANHYLFDALMLRVERRADDFAIQHATGPEELEATATVYQKKFQTVLDEARTHYYGVFGWKTVQIHPMISSQSAICLIQVLHLYFQLFGKFIANKL
jgi:hypothetical protein